MKPIPGKTPKQRAAYFVGGRATTGIIEQLDKKQRTFTKHHVAKLRGRIVTGPNGRWKFRTADAALSAAKWFLAHCQKTAA